MKQILLLILLVLCPFVAMNAMGNPELINLSPKDEADICNPIKRTPLRTPIVGIEGTKLVRLQAATNFVYYIEVLQDNEVVFSSNWNFQAEELCLPSELSGEFEVILSDGSKSFVGTFVID